MTEIRAGQPVISGNVMGECPACHRRIGELHAEHCDPLWDELREANASYRKHPEKIPGDDP